jgi:hypothetical protein
VSIEKARQKRALITLKTPLDELPREWVKYIEPYVIRGGFLPCWVWAGKINRYGHPYLWTTDPLTGKSIRLMAHRMVARIFWDFPSKWYIRRTCDTINCVNPAHIVPTDLHPNHWLYKKDS